MSAGFACICFGLGGIVYAAGRPPRLAVAMAYFGLMELLQTVQYRYVAVPEDGYEMCKNPTNQWLTFIGLLHIIFQPYFTNLALGATARTYSIKARYMNDMTLRLTLIFAFWCYWRYFMAVYYPDNPDMAARPSKECPNYEWVRDGYDAAIDFDTPNLPGHSCTFISNTTTGHIAWAAPLYQATYFSPGASLHFFLMFAPALVTMRHVILGSLFLLSGPVMAAYLTPSMNEQASVWCFFSFFQCIAYTIIAFVACDAQPKVNSKAGHNGGWGEKPMLYQLVDTLKNGKKHV